MTGVQTCALPISVLGEEDVAALASEMHARDGHGVAVARRIATDDQTDATNVRRVRAAHQLHAACVRTRSDALEANDFLSNSEDRSIEELVRLVDCNAQVDAVQAGFVLNHKTLRTEREDSVPWREIRVAREQASRLATDDGCLLQVERVALGTVGTDEDELPA